MRNLYIQLFCILHIFSLYHKYSNYKLVVVFSGNCAVFGVDTCQKEQIS
jgi:hypothetical protein